MRQPPDPDTSAAIVLCDVDAVPANLATVHALVRLALAARRAGCRVQVRGLSQGLAELLELCGLTAVLPVLPEEQAGRD